MNKDARQMDLVRCQLPRLHDVLHLGDGDARGGGHGWVEVACRAAEDEVAPGVRLVGLHQAVVAADGVLHHVLAAVELAHLALLAEQQRLSARVHLHRELAACQDGAHSGGRVEGRDPCAAGTTALCQRPLWHQLHLKLAAHVLLLEQTVLTNVAAHHSTDLTLLKEKTEAKVIHASIVADHGEVTHFVTFVQCLNQTLRNATQSKSTDQQSRRCRNISDCLRSRGIHLVDAMTSTASGVGRCRVPRAR
mmetsp:Transcript_210/g.628  ORF Transcript_210/g.628 Transcript_210/m.628 type:complete len:249 (+) Transcript_210:911-1657(+)